MNPSDSNDEHDPLRDALRRDAARVPQPEFDAALHHDTMRRIRGLDRKPQAHSWWRPAPVPAGAAMIVVGMSAALWLLLPYSTPTPEPGSPAAVATITTTPAETLPRSSLLRYEAAAREGDAALLAALDRDSTVLLPPSPAAFATPPL